MHVLYEISMNDYAPTGRVTHYRGDATVGTPHSLEIGKFERDAGFYLVGLDEEGQEITDTYHDSLARALEHAEFEFGIPSAAWISKRTGEPDQPRDDRTRADD